MSTEQTEPQELDIPQTLEGALNTLNLQKTLLGHQRELITSQGDEITELTEQRDTANSRLKITMVSLAIAEGCIGFLLVLLVFVLKHYHAL